MTTADVLDRLRKACDKAGSQRRAAKQLGVSPSYLNDVLTGDKEPAGKLIEAMGLRREVRYVKI